MKKKEKDVETVFRKLLEIYEICTKRKWPFWFRWGEMTGGVEIEKNKKS